MNNFQDGSTAGPKQSSHLPLVLDSTFRLLRQAYEQRQYTPGNVDRIYLKPGWLVVTGTRDECGIVPYPGEPGVPPENNSRSLRQLQLLAGMPLLVIPDLTLSLDPVLARSIKLAVLCALSQRFLGCPAVRSHGWHAECWRADDSFICENPVLSHVIRPDDVVAVAGPGAGCWTLREICRELHVVRVLQEVNQMAVRIGSTITAGPLRVRLHTPDELEEVIKHADVVLIPSSALVTGTFETSLESAKHARLTGLFGPGVSLIPDAFFSRGIDFIQSGRIIDPLRFNDDIINDPDIGTALRRSQKQFLFLR